MNVGLFVLSAVIAYLIGSISFARIMVRIFAPQVDIEKVLSAQPPMPGRKMMYISPTTVSAIVGTKAGVAASLLDIFKGMLAVIVIKLLFPGTYYFLAASVLVIVGHNWPIYYRFNGGGGLSPMYGSLLIVDPLCVPVIAVLGLLFGFLILRDETSAYSSGSLFAIPWFWFRTYDGVFLIYALVLNVVMLISFYPIIILMWKAHRSGEYDMVANMQQIPMGRGMLVIGRKLGLVK